MVFDLDMIKRVYEMYPEKMAKVRELIDTPLTLSEKILYTHLWNENSNVMYDENDDVAQMRFFPEENHMLILHQIELLCKMLQLKWHCFNLCKQVNPK